jgi:hypothetical protein
MRVLGIPPYHRCEVTNCVLVVLYHLEAFRSFMEVPNVAGHTINTAAEGPYRLFKLLHSSVREADVVVDIGLVGQERPI